MVREVGAAGFAMGASQVGSPVGLMFGHYIVSKWRNLNQQQRAELHGIVEGDRRTGPLLVTIYDDRSEEHTSELQSLMRISYAVFCLKKKTKYTQEVFNINTKYKHYKTYHYKISF